MDETTASSRTAIAPELDVLAPPRASSIELGGGPGGRESLGESGCRLEVHAIERDTFTEYQITGTIEGRRDASGAADVLLAQLAEELTDRGIQPVQEKYYGLASVREEILSRRTNVFRHHELDVNIPVTWIQGTPLLGCDFAGFQVWGIAPRGGWTCVSTVEDPVAGRGRLWTGRGFRMLYLPGMRGTLEDGSLPARAPEQAERMFENVGAALRAQQFSYRNVVRTWIYMARLLEWYDDFNRVRTAHYRREGLGVEGGPAFPASTGILGRSGDEECMMDVLALESDGPQSARTQPIRRSPRQDSSFNYGSAFSRGMTVEIEGKRTVYISGTASINTEGQSTHLGDAECQSLETLMSIGAILEEQGGSLDNIAAATLFCKDRAAWEAWRRVTRLLRIPNLPKICVIADVCRSDLLVEMESVAFI